ncbi:MAG: PrpR N-terminal domain-containing protein [Clostridium sp.]
MANNKVHILGIAPYEGMKSIMQKLAKEREDIELSVYVGNLHEGAEIARRNFHEDIDIIISRGGTAELIGTLTKLPVIEISLSVYDILRAIRLAENFSTHYAIVGFPSITGSAHLLCDLLQYKVEIRTIHNKDEVQEVLESLRQEGYKMVLCDMIANTIAKKLGLNAILITSGNESIGSALDQAVKLCTSHAVLREENHFLQNVIRSGSHQTIVFSERGELFFSTLNEDNSDHIVEILKKEIPVALTSNPHRSFKNIGGVLYSITSHLIPFCNEAYVVFNFSSNNVPFASSKYGVRYLSKNEAENNFFDSFYSVTSALGDMQSIVEQMTQTDFPIMIIGEEGTGKEQVVNVIYTQSPLQNNPLIIINFALMNDKSWVFLTNHYNSPFNDNNNTIYLKNIDILPEDRLKQLLSIIIDMNLCHRNRLIFSCVNAADGAVSKACMDFVNLLSCMTVHLPPLRERKEDIPSLANLSLSTLNVNLAKEILGLEAGAIALLKNYEWPYNYTQFKRVLSELTIITTTPYITEHTVAELLEKEQNIPISRSNSASLSHLNLERTLDEINQDIIQFVLEENGGNQSLTAKKLGISRTTLWRLLK